MKISIIILLILHGLLHILGFTKAFGIYSANQLTQPISKSTGTLWLLAFALFLITALLYASKNNSWWMVGVASVFVSQILILYSWHDAKYGTLANIIIVIACIIGYGTWGFYQKYKNDVQTAMQEKEYFQNSILSETDIQQLPESIKKYIRYSGCIGNPKVNNFKIILNGKIRKDEQSEWMPFTSEQYNFMNPPTRLFYMKAEMKNLPVSGYHCYKNGIAFMDIRLFSLFKVQFQEGKEMNEAETVTFFNDMCCMAPATLIDKRIIWQEVDSMHTNARFTNNGITINAELFFNKEGELVNFKSNDRYNADTGKKLPWSTPLRKYKEKSGHKFPSYAETIYTYPDRDLGYGIFNVSSIQYNYTELK
ncbi:MAG: hypothetical protein KA347_05685 [Bacteroidia bacterium]|jgi:hypothetical protein|nr:hypothetical protein [Bacteroidia bacterium]MBP7245188.1 hypothetical protein [Bacteroidia bacterium]